jgi:MFS family permease
MSSRSARYSLLFALALTEVLPIMLLLQALPVLMRRAGASMQQLGILFLATLPWSLKAVWAPVIDGLGARWKIGRYRGFLLIAHPLVFLTLVAGSFWDIPSLLTNNRAASIAALIWLTSICAVADAASHGLAVTLLTPDERGMGNGVQTAGLMAGQLIGGGLMVIFVEHLGWRTALLLISAFVILPLPGIALYKEQPVNRAQTLTLKEVVGFFRQPHMGRWLLVVATMPLGASLMTPAIDVLLVDRGFSLSEIGLVVGVLSSVAGAVGGLFGGTVVKKFGRLRAFYLLVGFSSLCLGLVLFNRMATGRLLLYLLVAVPSVGIMARATVLHVIMMDRCRTHLASTDFTLQYTVQHVSRKLGMSLGAFMAGYFGSMTVFALGPVLTLAVAIAASRLLDAADFIPPAPPGEDKPAQDPATVSA